MNKEDVNDNLDSNSDEIIPVTIRFPADVHSKVKVIADYERRSFNSQVIRMLDVYLDTVVRFVYPKNEAEKDG